MSRGYKFLIFFIVGTVLSALFGAVLKTGVFEKEAISEKYVYLRIRDSILDKIDMTPDKEQAFRNYYYYHNLQLNRDIVLKTYESTVWLKPNSIVEVLSYEQDSLLVKVRIHVKSDQRGGMEYDEVGYLPFFTLHDNPLE